VTLSIEEILAGAELPEESVQLCLKGSLVRRYEELERQVLVAATVSTNLGERAPASQISAQLEELRAEMAPWQVSFQLRAVTPKAWRNLLDEQPSEPDPKKSDEAETYDDRFHAWVCKLVAVSCAEPAMTPEQAAELHDKLSGGQWKALTDTAWALNAERKKLPFSAAASDLIASTAQNSRRPAPGESAHRAGSVKSPAKSPRTSTKKAS